MNACKLRYKAISGAIIRSDKNDAALLHGMPFSIKIFPSGDAESEWNNLINSLPALQADPSAAGKSSLTSLSESGETVAEKLRGGRQTISIYCLDDQPLFVGTRLLAVDVTLSPASLYLLAVMAFGAVGAFIYCFVSYAKHLGQNDFGLAWLAWYITLPVVGAGLGATVYVIFRAGYLPTGDNIQINPFGFAATAALAGLFSRHVLAKLRRLAIEILSDPDKDENAATLANGDNHPGSDAEEAATKSNKT